MLEKQLEHGMETYMIDLKVTCIPGRNNCPGTFKKNRLLAFLFEVYMFSSLLILLCTLNSNFPKPGTLNFYIRILRASRAHGLPAHELKTPNELFRVEGLGRPSHKT